MGFFDRKGKVLGVFIMFRKEADEEEAQKILRTLHEQFLPHFTWDGKAHIASEIPFDNRDEADQAFYTFIERTGMARQLTDANSIMACYETADLYYGALIKGRYDFLQSAGDLVRMRSRQPEPAQGTHSNSVPSSNAGNKYKK